LHLLCDRASFQSVLSHLIEVPLINRLPSGFAVAVSRAAKCGGPAEGGNFEPPRNLLFASSAASFIISYGKLARLHGTVCLL